MKYVVFYSSGQTFILSGQWLGVEKLADKLIAPVIEDDNGRMNIVDPRALVVSEDSKVIYNGREWRKQMSSALRSAMPKDWPERVLRKLRL